MKKPARRKLDCRKQKNRWYFSNSIINIPAGVEKHFWKKKKHSSGAVAPHTFYDEHYLKFSRGKFNDFEGMT
jgi:hypothetical protein